MKSKTFDSVCTAIAHGNVHVTEHAYDEATTDNLAVLDVVDAAAAGEVIEDYPDDPRGRSCLVLAQVNGPVHAVWAFDDGTGRAILVTVYRPDRGRWSDDFRERR